MQKTLTENLLPPVLFLSCLLLAVALHVLWPVAAWTVPPWSLPGLLPVAVGLWLLVSGSRRFARERTNIHTFREPDVLVTTGVFRITRNPMYLGFTLVLGGLVICLGTVSPWLAVLVFFAAAQLWYIPFEERACQARFGERYLAYQARTRRWL